MIPNNKNAKEVKMLYKTGDFQISVTGSGRTFINGGTQYALSVDLTQYDWYPKNVIAILPSQCFKSGDGNSRAIIVPHIDKPTSSIDIYAPSSGTYYCRVSILYQE